MVQPIFTPRLIAVGGQYRIPVGYRDADRVRSRLRKGGVRSTLVIDPVARTAHFELWPGADLAKARAALGGLR
jgi:hypothetical protein